MTDTITATFIAATCTGETRDEAWEEYVASLDAAYTPAYDGTLAKTVQEARRIRMSYERWLCRKIDEGLESGDDVSFLISEMGRLEATDGGFNAWNARPTIDDLEYGHFEELPRWADLGWTVDKDERAEDAPSDAAEDITVLTQEDVDELAQLGPDLIWVNEQHLLRKDEAQKFVDGVRQSFRKGDHSAEVIETRVDKGTEAPFVAVVLESDGNWGHRKALAAERDRHLANALRRIEEAETEQELRELARIARRYSRDMQVLNSGKTFDGQPKVVTIGYRIKPQDPRPLRETAEPIRVCTGARKVGIGWNYIRFAKAMNAIADRAKELGIDGFREYTIKDFESTRKPTDGDVLDVGCRQGEFLALEKPDESCTEASMWSQIEGTWKPSSDCARRLLRAGPTSFVYRPWKQILADFDANVSLNSEPKALPFRRATA